MIALRIRILAVAMGAAIALSAGAENGVQLSYSETLQNVHLEYATSEFEQAVSVRIPQSIQFEAYSKFFDIRLISNQALLSATQRESLSPGIGVYRGELSNVDGSWARFVIVDGVPRGMFWDGQDVYAVEVPQAQNAPIIFRLDDLHIEPGALTCSHSGSSQSATELVKAVSADFAAASGPGATQQIDMAIIADFEFASAKGASTEADLIARMNNIDGIFSSQLGMQLNVNRIDTFTDSNDPFTDESNASVLIDELSDYRSATPEQNANGLTHLFTGRDLDGTTVGIAFNPAICSQRFGAGLTQGTFSLTTDSLIAAHEIGHNFGAPHDGTAGSDCEAEPETFLMAPSVNGSDEFSSCSITEMQAVIATRTSCLSPVPSTDVAVVSGAQGAVGLLGDTETISFTVNSTGTNTADSVVLDVTVPPSVTLNSVTTGAGSCTSGAGSVSCSLGSIVSGSGVTVSLEVTNITTGNADFSASVSASVDENSNNNQSSLQFTIDPAVELVATPGGFVQVTLNQSAMVSPAVENLSTLPATNVELTVTPAAGLRIDSGSWAAGSCSVAADVLTCQASSLAAQSSTAVSMQVTGLSEGNISYAMSVSSAEVDIDTANNSADGSVTVGAIVVPPPPEESGGGSVDWFLLALLTTSGLMSIARGSRIRPGLLSTAFETRK